MKHMDNWCGFIRIMGKESEMNEEMKFEVRLTAKELWLFSMYHANSGIMGLFNLLFTLAALFLLVFRWGDLTVAYRFLMFGCALIFTVLQPLLLYGKVRRQAQNTAMQQPMYLTFHKNGLKVEQRDQEAEFTWEQMGRMDKKWSMTVLYMDRVHAYLLPKKVLGDQEEKFFAMAKEHLPKERRKGF